jgi:hypothetical protein
MDRFASPMRHGLEPRVGRLASNVAGLSVEAEDERTVHVDAVCFEALQLLRQHDLAFEG